MTNLICKGDFEDYVKQLPYSSNSKFEASNYSCWYDKTGQELEFKVMEATFSPILTAFCDLVNSGPTVPCQNIVLENGKEY